MRQIKGWWRHRGNERIKLQRMEKGYIGRWGEK